MDELDELLSGVPPARAPRTPASPRPVSMRPPRPQPPPAPRVSPEVGQSRTSDLHNFVTSSGFELSPGRSGYATGGHNPGSLHGEGYAVDVRVRDREPKDVDDFISKAQASGFVVRDERTRPAGQSVWDGPHVHLEYNELGKALADLPAKDELDSLLADVPDAEEVITINARADAPIAASLALRALPQRQSFHVRTMEGRRGRDERAAMERAPKAKLTHDVPLPAGVNDWSQVSSEDASRQAARSYAASRGIPSEFVERWLGENASKLNLHLYDAATGERREPADYIYEGSPAYDFEKRTLRVSSDMPHLKQLEDDFKASRGTLQRVGDWAGSDSSAGEKVLDVAGAVAAPVVKGAGYAARPFQATSAGVFSALRGHNPLPVAYNTLTTGETPAEGSNPVGNYLRDSDVLNRINPRLGRMLGGGADVILDPANLIGLGILGKGAKLVAGAGRVSRAAEEVSALGRSLGVLERGLVESRPLGLGRAAVAEGGELAALEDRLSRVSEVTRKLKAGEALTPEEAALHAEVKATSEAAPSAAVRSEQLKYASERAAHYEEVAQTAKSAGARKAARELADDYVKEAARLEGVEAPAPEGFAVSPSRFRPESPDAATRPLWRRGLGTARDVAQLPKIKAGWDVSATGRQGLAQAAAHPSYLKEAFAHQVKAFASEDAANEFAQAIRNRPDFELMNDSGLFLSSVGPEAEEAFASKLAQKIPGARASDRAYSAALDSIRTQAWDNYVASLPERLRDNPRTLKAVAELVNISTGRGVFPVLDRSALGKKVVDILNVPFFSPRNTASKFNLISPARLAKNMMSAETRPVAYLQLRDASRGLASLGTTLGLLHLAGADVSVNPSSSDFGKVRVGKAVYDLTGGQGYTVRYLAQMARTAVNEARRKRIPKGAGLTELTRRYLRTQLQPLAATGADWWTGKTIDGKPVTSASAALNLITPFVVDDVIKGFREEGWLGAVKGAPGVLGVGVNFYDKPRREKKGGGVQSNRLNLEGEPESRNVEDQRPAPSRWTDEDSAALVDEVSSAGASPVTDEQGARLARVLDGLDDQKFAEFARNLDEHYNSGVLRPLESAATYAAEYGAEGLARLRPSRAQDYRNLAGAARALRLLAEERAARPVQFTRDALAGKYGEKMRAEVEEGVYYPQNQFPSSMRSPLKLDGILEPAAPPPAPESPETLRQQFKSPNSEDSPRVGVLLTPGERLRRVPPGFARIEHAAGTLYLNRRKLKAAGLASRAGLKEFITRNGFEPLIGKVAPVADTSKGMALRTEDARGVELSTSIVPDERAAEAQAAEDLAQFPHAARQEMGTAQEMVARRLEGAAASPEHAELRRRVDAASADAKPTFVEFDEGAGTLRVPREAMPQVESRHRGAMVNYLRGRGITHSLEEVPAGELLPSQAEWSPEKVARALSHEGPERRMLISSDNHVADGHHQWLGAVYEDPSLIIPVIRLHAPIARLLLEMARFPSSGVDDASARRRG